MNPPSRGRRKAAAPAETFPATALAVLGLAGGEAVRFRRRDSQRWQAGTVVRREGDGSLGIRDLKGALRALPLDAVEVRDKGPRGGVVWEPVTARAARTEQMKLL